MKRRAFGLMAGTSMVALLGVKRQAFADSPNAALLTTTLTPLGGERAGNAAGTIPAWTGGMTEVPAGVSWDPTTSLPPDFFASDPMLYEVNASNMAQYSDLIGDGLKYLITNNGLSLKVYPTHRTASAPQWMYDNTAQNLSRSTLEPGGGRLGFLNGYCGIPFAIPDTSDPYAAGAQIIWNHLTRWSGPYLTQNISSFTMSDGVLVQGSGNTNQYRFGYYLKDQPYSDFDGYYYAVYVNVFGPANAVGGELISMTTVNSQLHPNITWQVLAGQGRVRKAPEVEYDTPSSYASGICNYDEYYGFNGAMDRYDWKYLGKREMLIPYNNNKTFHMTAAESHDPHIYNPEAVRWELHRVWVVEATLHQHERNVLARRMFYVDEDTWIIGVVDSWDAKENLFRCGYGFNANFPNLPGTIFANNILYNLQTNEYVSVIGSYADKQLNMPWNFNTVPNANFNPQHMAAASSY